ncbi:MAG TPA: hypothetical protein VL380_06685 [Nitrosospira sp.]|nr:hypothetical protein [Nitrosospira sp.]
MSSNLLIAGSLILIGLVWAGAWIFRKIRLGEMTVGFHTALLGLLAVILLVPFAMNFGAHLISNMVRDPSGIQHDGQSEDLAPPHKHDTL